MSEMMDTTSGPAVHQSNKEERDSSLAPDTALAPSEPQSAGSAPSEPQSAGSAPPPPDDGTDLAAASPASKPGPAAADPAGSNRHRSAGGPASCPAACPGGKPTGFDLWRGRLGSARLVVAPMVDQSEAAWRMLSRKYGAELCYTPMYHANVFVKDAKYRRECLTTYPEDRPLIIQFCANNPANLLEAARYCQGGEFDALDINLGCPQSIARRGHYGAFLQDEWELISQLVKVVHEQTDLPVTCKIRIFDDLEKTIRYVRMLQSAGCQLLTVHGRTREMKGPLTGLADWDAIRAVREAVSIPVFANGNIQYLSDVHRCLEHTGAQGVMSAEGNLHNPALFVGRHPPVWQMAEEYLQLVRRYPCPLSYARGHIFKILHYCLLMPANHDVRQLAARASRLEQLEEAAAVLRQRYGHHTEPGGPEWRPGTEDGPLSRLPLSPLLCQPHEREPIEDHLRKMQANAEKQRREREAGSEPPAAAPARAQDPTALSKRKLKKLARGAKIGANRAIMERCSACCNPRGLRCEFLLCRLHCRNRCYEQNLDCAGHRILVKTKRQNARKWHDRQRQVEGAAEGVDGRPRQNGSLNGTADEMGSSSGREDGGTGEMDPPSGGEDVRPGEMDPPGGGEDIRPGEMDPASGVGEDSGAGEMDQSSGGEAAASDSAVDPSAAVVS